MRTTSTSAFSQVRPPVHLTRRQALWGIGAVLLIDFLWFRALLPALLSAKSDVALGAGIVLSLAIVLTHIDVVWSYLDPADSPKWESPKVLVLCAFCGAATGVTDDMLRNGEMPAGWSAFRHGHGQNVNACGRDDCRVAMAKQMAAALRSTPS